MDETRGAPRMVLDEVSALTNAGSLLSSSGEIVASYDLEVTDTPALEYRDLSQATNICNAARRVFSPDYANQSRVHVINGMGVTLGDSIIGLTALSAIANLHPSLQFVIYRPAHAPRYVKQLYELAAPLFGTMVDLPIRLDTIPERELKIDMGNHLFWPNFSTSPMIDFFLDALGVRPADIPSEHKRNHWLKRLALPLHEWHDTHYVLMCPDASTPVRSIPPSVRPEIVERLWKRFGLPVVGFGAVNHLHYKDVTVLSSDTGYFLSWIKHARYVVTSDTAALHIAAGFDIPTTAFFSTVPSALRARDYERCTSIELDVPELEGLHASHRLTDLKAIDRAYHDLTEEQFAYKTTDAQFTSE
jgi:hypothetical protein